MVKFYWYLKNLKRNINISFDLLNGETLKNVGEKYSLTPGYIRCIVARFCRISNHTTYCKCKCLKDLRNNKKTFFDGFNNAILP